MLFLIGLGAAATVTWSVAEGAEMRPRIVATVDGKSLIGEEQPLLFIEHIADFNGDGTLDAFVSWSGSGGGNCCPPNYSFYMIEDGKLIQEYIEVYSWEGSTIVPGTPPRISFLEDKKETVIQLKGKTAIRVQEVPRAQLATVAEVRGPGTMGSEGTRTLRADINGDEKIDIINCEIWSRWGSLLCTLPLPAGPQTLSIGCERFGVLATKTNGYNDMVCDYDLVLKYNGKEYVEASELPVIGAKP